MPARLWPPVETTFPPSSESSAAREPLDGSWEQTPAKATMRSAATAYRPMPHLVNIAGLLANQDSTRSPIPCAARSLHERSDQLHGDPVLARHELLDAVRHVLADVEVAFAVGGEVVETPDGARRDAHR